MALEKMPLHCCFVLLSAGVAFPAMAQPQDNRLAARIAALEAQVARLTSALETANAARDVTPPAPVLAAPVPAAVPSNPAPATPAAAAERFALAALHLQVTLGTSRPYLRELQTLRDAAPPGGLPSTLADALVSHASRGLPNASELRESFLAIAPALVERAADHDGWLDWALAVARRMLARLGLVEPPPLPPSQATIANVSRLLARGMIAPALADIESLDPALMPLLGGWLAQARARVAADQAVQETILRALNRAAPG